MFGEVAQAEKLVEKANANLEPELLTRDAAHDLLQRYARLEKLVSFGKTVLARKLDDAGELARVTGTSIPRAKVMVETGKALSDADEVRDAFQGGDISLDQASEIARAEQARRGAASELLPVATGESFQVLRERARRIVLEAEQSRDLAARQKDARAARSYSDELGMVHVHLASSPTSAPPSSTAPRPRPPASTARREKRATASPSSATSPMPTRRSWRVRARGGPGVPSWSYSSRMRSPSGAGRT